MNRSDWVFVGVRLYGVYLLVSGVLQLAGLLQQLVMIRDMDEFEPSFVFMTGSGALLLQLLLGSGLFLGAPTLERWLRRRDARPEGADRAA